MLTDGWMDERTNGRKLARLCLPAKAGATKRGIIPEQQDRWRKKKKWVRLYFMYMPHISFQDSSNICWVLPLFKVPNNHPKSTNNQLRNKGHLLFLLFRRTQLVSSGLLGQTDGWMDGQAQTNMPPQLL